MEDSQAVNAVEHVPADAPLEASERLLQEMLDGIEEYIEGCRREHVPLAVMFVALFPDTKDGQTPIQVFASGTLDMSRAMLHAAARDIVDANELGLARGNVNPTTEHETPEG